MEKEVKVVTYGIIQVCDNCSLGEMIPTGNNRYVPDIEIQHQCSNCQYKKTYPNRYPLIRYRTKT